MRIEDLLDGAPRARPLPPDSGPVDLVAAVRAADWEIWVAWLLGEDPCPIIERLPPARRRLRMRIELDVSTSTPGRRGHAHTGLRFRRRCDAIEVPPPLTHPLGCGCPIDFKPLTLERDVPSPRGMRRRWWPREAEIACPDWRGAALGIEPWEAD